MISKWRRQILWVSFPPPSPHVDGRQLPSNLCAKTVDQAIKSRLCTDGKRNPEWMSCKKLCSIIFPSQKKSDLQKTEHETKTIQAIVAASCSLQRPEPELSQCLPSSVPDSRPIFWALLHPLYEARMIEHKQTQLYIYIRIIKSALVAVPPSPPRLWHASSSLCQNKYAGSSCSENMQNNVFVCGPFEPTITSKQHEAGFHVLKERNKPSCLACLLVAHLQTGVLGWATKI